MDFKKTTFSLAALCAIGSCFADPLTAGYNAPAGIDLDKSWSFYTGASFTYWLPYEDNIEPGIVSTIGGIPAIHGSVIKPHCDFKPGFKVIAGFNSNYDNWDTGFEYTWFRGINSTHRSVPAASKRILPLWLSPQDSLPNFDSMDAHWHLGMDLLDWKVGRESLVGQHLSIYPFFALRAAWIRQLIRADYFGGALSPHFVAKHSHSWGLGPKMGVATTWMFGSDFRLFANADGDILFTQYEPIEMYEGATLASGTAYPTKAVSENDLNAVRSHLATELGLGWCHYFGKDSWRMDLSASYGFQVFYDQNMFRTFVDDVAQGCSFSPCGNLYFQGLTVSARFDF